MDENLTIKEKIKKEIEKVKAMDNKGKWSYFRTYYMWKTLLLLGCILCFVWLVYDMTQSAKEPVVCGCAVNVNMNTTGFSYFTDDYSEYLGLNKKDNQAQISIDNTLNFLDGQDMDNATYEMALIAQFAVGDYDYLLMDQYAYEYFVKHDVYADLEEVLSKEQQEKLKDYFVTTKSPESGKEFVSAIRLTDTDLFKRCDFSSDEVYFVIINVSQENGRAVKFVDYLSERL